jgi:hypothetical protein
MAKTRTRPAIVIGLGGTGQWILTFLKKELLELGAGEMPAQVKLISFDTTSKTTATTGQMGKRGSDEPIKAGAVELVDGIEFIPIGQNVNQLVSEIASGKHSHLQWFPAASFLGKLPPAAFNTKEGSGQIRQMGRISIFRDLSSLQTSDILSRLRQAIQDLQGQVSRDAQLEIIIVGSLAGGTGAGMLVDMAILARAQAAQLVQNNFIVRGFFVLPRAFVASGIGEGRDMLARSFATWRELDRFMIVSERFGVRQINYHEQNNNLRIQVDRRAYDVSYMIDPARNAVNSLDNIRSEEGLFPAIAQVLSALLDDKAGKAYTEFVAANLAGKLAQLPRKPYHSAVGSYTIKVPVFFAQEKFSHQLALDVLEKFLAPEMNEKGRVVGVSELKNREVAEGRVGRRAALDFMQASALNINGNEIPNTLYMKLVADIREKEAQRDNAYVLQWARGGLTNGQSRVLKSLTDISQDNAGKLIIRDINDELQFSLWKEVPPSHTAGDTPEQAFLRMKNRIPEVRSEHYGLDTVMGERLRGKYGKALDVAKNAQVARYSKLLQAWTQNVLNGQSSDPVIARGGKIGYIRSFYAELANTFSYYIVFLNKVRLCRNEDLKLDSRSKQAAEQALKTYQDEGSKKGWFTFWDNNTHPDAHQAQRNYLDAEQRVIDVRRDDILLDVLAETALEMQRIVENTRDEIDNWIAHLATGDSALNIQGLYQVANESLANVNINHELDKRLKKVVEIIGEHEYQQDQTYINDILSQLRWQVELQDDKLILNCGIDMPDEEQNKPPTYIAFRRSGDKPEQFNLNTILELSERPYQVLHRERPMAREIIKEYPTGKKLAEVINELAEPLYMTGSVPAGPEVVACYIRAHTSIDEETSAYFAEFEQEMKARKPEIKGSSLTLVDSEDPYKLTIVRSNDLLPSSDFDMWEKCRQAYIEQVTDPHRGIPAAELHVFPSEINACYYEARMPKLLRQNYRILHPEVVALLEDREKFEMFFRAFALGFIHIDESKGQFHWVFQLPDEKEPLYLTAPAGKLDSSNEEDFFQIIHNFAMDGRDQRSGMGGSRFVDWEKLRDIIYSQQAGLGKTKSIKAYREQLDSPKGIVQRIRSLVKAQRDQIQDQQLRNTVGMELEDLTDLATVIYQEVINSMESHS